MLRSSDADSSPPDRKRGLGPLNVVELNVDDSRIAIKPLTISSKTVTSLERAQGEVRRRNRSRGIAKLFFRR